MTSFTVHEILHIQFWSFDIEILDIAIIYVM